MKFILNILIGCLIIITIGTAAIAHDDFDRIDSTGNISKNASIEKPKGCLRWIRDIAAFNANFTQCVIKNTVPVNICLECFDRYEGLTRFYNMVKKDAKCFNKYVTSDDKHRIDKIYALSISVWNDGKCHECVVDEDKIQTLLDVVAELNICIDKDPSTACKDCENFYKDMESKYADLRSQRNESEICADVLDAVNNTKIKWTSNGCVPAYYQKFSHENDNDYENFEKTKGCEKLLRGLAGFNANYTQCLINSVVSPFDFCGKCRKQHIGFETFYKELFKHEDCKAQYFNRGKFDFIQTLCSGSRKFWEDAGCKNMSDKNELKLLNNYELKEEENKEMKPKINSFLLYMKFVNNHGSKDITDNSGNDGSDDLNDVEIQDDSNFFKILMNLIKATKFKNHQLDKFKYNDAVNEKQNNNNNDEENSNQEEINVMWTDKNSPTVQLIEF